MSWVRLRIGDTSSGDVLLENEEIEALIDTGGNKVLGAALAAESLGGKFARRADKAVGKLRIQYGKVADSYFRLADRLRYETQFAAVPYAGGVSVSDMESEAEDDDRPERMFKLDQFENESQP